MNESRPNSKTFTTDYVLSTADLPPQLHTTTTQTLSWIDTRTGVDNPRYKQQIKSGSNATTPFTGVKYTVEASGQPTFVGRYKNIDPKKADSVATFKGYPTSPSFLSDSGTFTSADNAALGKFYSSARSAVTSFEGMTFLGEIAETIHMLRRPGDSLFKGLERYRSAVKKRCSGVRKLRELESIIGSTYLEHAFGWVPLISDTKDALQALAKLQSQQRFVGCGGFGSEDMFVSNTTTYPSAGSTLIPTKTTIKKSVRKEVRYKGAVKGVCKGPSVGNALDLMGFRLDEFVPTVYELIPFSFVADYFSNLGDIVSATSYVKANLAWVSKTTRSMAVVEAAMSFDNAKAGISSKFKSGSGNASWKTTRASVTRDSVVPGVPGLEFTLPGVKQVVNLAALALSFHVLSSNLSKSIR